MIGWAVAMGCLGAIFLAVGLIIDPVEYDVFGNAEDIDMGAANLRFWALVGGGGLFSTSLMLGLAGIIVRAIWFLPGDETKVPRP